MPLVSRCAEFANVFRSMLMLARAHAHTNQITLHTICVVGKQHYTIIILAGSVFLPVNYSIFFCIILHYIEIKLHHNAYAAVFSFYYFFYTLFALPFDRCVSVYAKDGGRTSIKINRQLHFHINHKSTVSISSMLI